MNKYFVCSPYAGYVQANVIVANALGRWVFLKYKAVPVVPHVFFTTMLQDSNPEERQLGITGGQVLMADCSRMIHYTQKGNSDGMVRDLKRAGELGLEVIEKPDLVGVMENPVVSIENFGLTCVVCHQTYCLAWVIANPRAKASYEMFVGADLTPPEDIFKEAHQGCLTRKIDWVGKSYVDVHPDESSNFPP